MQGPKSTRNSFHLPKPLLQVVLFLESHRLVFNVLLHKNISSTILRNIDNDIKSLCSLNSIEGFSRDTRDCFFVSDKYFMFKSKVEFCR